VYAIISDRSKQFTVKAGDRIEIDLRNGLKEGDELVFDQVLYVGGDEGKVKIGSPTVAGVKVHGKVENALVKEDKKFTWKWVRREQYQRRVGHRQKVASVRITKIEA